MIFQLRESMPRNVLVAYVDLQATTSNACEEIYFRLIQALRRELAIKRPGMAVPECRLGAFDPAASYPNVAADFSAALQALREAEETGGDGTRMLLLLDEIEIMIPNADWPGLRGYEDFFRYVRGLHQEHRLVVSALIGADPSLCHAWKDRDNPVYPLCDKPSRSQLPTRTSRGPAQLEV